MKIRLTGTGTSQGVPVIACKCKVCKSTDLKDKRLRTSAIFEWGEHRYVIDTGPDFRQQMLNADVDHIDGIFYTHEHADHTAGLDDIRPLYFINKKPIPIFAHERVLKDLKKRFSYIFTNVNRYPGAPEVKAYTPKPYRSYFIGGKEIIPLLVNHGPLEIYAYKIDKTAYITDAKTIPDKTMELIYDLDLLIINALHHKPHKMHMNLKESLALIEELKPKKAVLIHISHHMGLHVDVEKQLPKNVYLGFDGMTFNI
jgi:phosphoribosyl 1,2-cyclic phosphate phosphodiesterase